MACFQWVKRLFRHSQYCPELLQNDAKNLNLIFLKVEKVFAKWERMRRQNFKKKLADELICGRLVSFQSLKVKVKREEKRTLSF